jgi:pilus assembly protein Flp/PilA
MEKVLRAFVRDCKGATAVEYGLILSLLVIAMVASLQGVATKTSTMWNNVAATVTKS